MSSGDSETQRLLDATEIKSPVRASSSTALTDEMKPLLPDDETTLGAKLAYAFGGFSLFLFATIRGFYFVVFLADVAEMNPFASGSILLFGKFIDAVTDPIVGQLSDCTKSSWGRRKPWIFWGSFPFAIFYFLLWQVPEFTKDNESVKISYYLVVSVLLDAAATVVYVPYAALLTDIATTYHSRTVFTSFRQIFGLLGTIVGAVGHGEIISAFEDADNPLQGEKDGYFFSALIFSIMIAIPWYFVVLFVPERKIDVSKLDDHGSVIEFLKQFVQEVKSLLQNQTYVILVVFYFFSFLVLQLFQSSFVLWIENVLEDQGVESSLLVIATLGAGVVIVIATKVSEKYGKKTAYYIFSCIGLPCQAAVYFVGSGDTTLVFALLPLQTFTSALSLLLPIAMLPDVIDQDELATGKRREGSYCSFFLMAQKVGQAVSLSAINYAIAGAGYKEPSDDDEDPEQPSGVVTILKLMIGPIPVLCGIIAILILRKYPLTKEVADDVRLQLQERHARQHSTQADI